MLSSSILPIEQNRPQILNRSNSPINTMKTSYTSSPNYLNIRAIVTSASSKKRARSSSLVEETSMSFDNSLTPSDYARTAFQANIGSTTDLESIVKDCESRFLPITTAMMEAYHTEILNAVRANDLVKAQVLYREGGHFERGCNACNRFGESILHIACRRGNLDMVKFLVEEVGLTITTIRDDYHRTPLHDAFWTSTASYETVDYLLKQPNVTELLLCKDKRGFTPLDYSRSEDRSKWLTFMWERRAELRPLANKKSDNCFYSTQESPSKRIRVSA